LEDNEKLETIFENSETGKITFSIGEENTSEDLSSCSVIKANICENGENIAQIGVIGPERMDYAKIAGALKYIVDEMKNLTKLDKGE